MQSSPFPAIFPSVFAYGHSRDRRRASTSQSRPSPGRRTRLAFAVHRRTTYIHETNVTVAERSSRGASYSAHDIIPMSAKELSALTGHGVDDCKTVLAECGGDVERAVDALLNSA